MIGLCSQSARSLCSLRSPRCSWICPDSGPHMGRQVVPRLALTAICRAQDLPDATSSIATIDAKLKQYMPNAHKHVHLTSDAPPVGAGGWQRFDSASRFRRRIERSICVSLHRNSHHACG